MVKSFASSIQDEWNSVHSLKAENLSLVYFHLKACWKYKLDVFKLLVSSNRRAIGDGVALSHMESSLASSRAMSIGKP